MALVGAGEGVARRRPARFAPTKFSAPARPASFVPRPALCDRLDRAPAGSLRLVIGSPGAGKTTLLADWAGTRPAGATAWLGVDAADADPVRFWQGLIAAVRAVAPGFGEEAFDLLTLDGVVDHDALESILISCGALDHRVDLVVDDFHLAAGEVHAHVRFLAGRGLGNLHLTIGTRSEPAIGLDRLRIGGHVIELRDADLRFAEDETAQLVRDLGLDLGDADLEALHRRTAGWVAGVQLAAVAMRDADVPQEFVRRMAGTNQAISPYLSFELLDAQPAAMQRFLLDTCVVDELSPALALALSPESGVALEQAEADGLLLTRLDPDGRTFRFHHLLTEMLRHRLHGAEPERELLLHGRAADWYRSEGLLGSAFRHRWRSGQGTEAMDVIHGLSFDQVLAGITAGVGDVSVSLTDSDISRSPGPSVGYCSAIAAAGRADEAATLAARIDRLVGPELDDRDRLQLLATRIASTSMLGDYRASRDLALGQYRPGPAGDEAGWGGLIEAVLLRSYIWEDEFEPVPELLAGPLDRASRELRSAIALLRLREGDLDEARREAEAVLSDIGRSGPSSDVTLPTFPARSVIGMVHLERGELAAATTVLGEVSAADAHARSGAVLVAHLGMVRLLRAEGRYDAAQVVLNRAHRLLPGAEPGSGIGRHLACFEARNLLDLGAPVEEAEARIEDLPDGFRVALVRSHLARHAERFAEAGAILDRLVGTAPTPRDALELALARLVQALATGAPSTDLAADVFDRAESLDHTFLVAEAGAAALDAVSAIGRRRPRTPYLDRLAATRPHAVPVARARPAFPIDALSERERTVLRYLVTSLSYREMADELFVSVNTVKSHVKNIIRKLHATSRADAIERARDLHYL